MIYELFLLGERCIHLTGKLDRVLTFGSLAKTCKQQREEIRE